MNPVPRSDHAASQVRMMVRTKNAGALAGLLVVALAACDTTPEQGLARGEALYDTCAPCHGPAGAGNQELGAPAIAGLPQWYVEHQLEKYENGWRGAHPLDTVGIKMRSMANALDLEGDRASVSEFVAQMPGVNPPAVLAVGDAQAGQQTYQTCLACHGPEGQGVREVNSPPLTGQHDWYLLSQLQKFKKGWRGTHPQDIWGATMRPNAMMLDDAAMENVVAYIQTLQ